MTERVCLDDFEAVADPVPDVPDSRSRSRNRALAKRSPRPATEPDEAGAEAPPALALEPDILGRLRVDLVGAGLAGEDRIAQIVYLAVTSRLLPWGSPSQRPVSLIVKGTSSSGKSHATATTLRLFPKSAYVLLGSMSRRFLFYDEESLAHRFLIVPEWATIASDEELVAMLRVLLSEGRIVHGTLDIEGQRRVARRIDKDGPMGLIVTTTAAAVDPEMETRCLSALTDDSQEQTRRVYKTLARLEQGSESIDWRAWHDLQEWLASHGETRVVVPFVEALAQSMPVGATRLRRDFGTLLSLVRAHAIVYRAQRERSEDGSLVATLDGDYAPVRELVSDLIAEGVDATVSTATRTTVEAVRESVEMGEMHATPAVVIARLELGRSAGYDRIKRALVGGYVVNVAARGDRAMKLAIGAPLPGDADFLPTVETLVQAMSGATTGHAARHAMGDLGSTSGTPASPVRVRVGEPSDGSKWPSGGNHDGAPGPQWWIARDGRRRRYEREPPAFPGEVVAVKHTQRGA